MSQGDLPTVRVLPADEFVRLQAFEPFASQGLPHPDHTVIVVAEQGREIVGFWGLFNAVHVEPLWIAEAHRQRPGLVRRLWDTIVTVLAQHGVQTAFALIAYQDQAQNLPMAQRLGFARLPGDLYFVRVNGGKE